MSTEQLTGTTVHMPALGESIDEGTITRWLKQPGEPVTAEEPLLEVATDKVDTEIPSPVTGVLQRILVAENDVVAVGAELAIIVDPATGPVDTPPAPTAVPRQEPAPGGTVVEKLPRIRRTIAKRMVESLQVAAQLTSVVEVDVTAIARLRAAHKDAFYERTGVKLSFLPFFAKAAMSALAQHRVLNASLDPDVTEVTYYEHCHLGMAVDSERGLMVPVIRDAHRMSIEQLARAIADKAEKVRTGTISPDELAGGTFTLTNTGSRGALFDTPIINQPQTGILGTGAVVERLVPARHDGALRIDVRSMAYLSLSYDHRIVDGADAARFLTAMKTELENGFTAAGLP
ncbi:dihydrolipoamide acetyltransferase family protein [Rhodococcus chondri]|uniref:Dihydrolipoamide acetyltransferase component of pyruvate dehydrogenase complex n=1 Tax=Rhodococcus chondri TaxID=3065941 RepID=A0ABU7JZZ1_9NOCA|nr:2-oxo acid dehydrogenase subunit E2 [Rhodococcus sp. CC-R104]MEE2035362.1 2-oxo acid dehydrogenase subunit E2 [Rhodococcus sp. CC-R104]